MWVNTIAVLKKNMQVRDLMYVRYQKQERVQIAVERNPWMSLEFLCSKIPNLGLPRPRSDEFEGIILPEGKTIR